MKCLSLNLWNINPPVVERMDSLSRYINAEKPDIICFQEVSPFKGKVQISELLTLAGYRFSYRESGVWKGREEGLAIATTLNISDCGFKIIPNSYSFNDMQRILQYVVVCYRGNVIQVYNTHLPYHMLSKEGREVHLRYICDVITRRRNNNPVILCGDFNSFPGEGLIEKYILGDLGLTDTWTGKEENSFSSSNRYASPDLWPGRRIDYVFADRRFNLKAKLCMTDNDGYAICSDHYGVVASGDLE